MEINSREIYIEIRDNIFTYITYYIYLKKTRLSESIDKNKSPVCKQFLLHFFSPAFRSYRDIGRSHFEI